MKLTPHFSLEEFTASDTADAHGIDNTPTPEHMTNIQLTAEGLEVVRKILGDRAIVITSGYRNPHVNALVGGVPDSDHALGWAADFQTAGLTPLQAGRILEASSLKFDQLILETSRKILHISFSPRMRRQVMTQPHGPGTPFVPGLVA